MPRLNLSLKGTGESPSSLGTILGWIALGILVLVTLAGQSPAVQARLPHAAPVCAPSAASPVPGGGR
jgi:hypothetical protein